MKVNCVIFCFVSVAVVLASVVIPFSTTIADWLQRNILSLRNSQFSSFSWLATKCPYFDRPSTTAHNALPWIKDNVPKGLIPIAVDGIFRHGTRYPSQENLDTWHGCLQKLSKFSKSKAVNFMLSSWDEYYPTNCNHTLHTKGKIEHEYLAENLFHMISDIFHKSKSLINLIEIHSSSKVRCLSSAEAFRGQLLKLINTNRNDGVKIANVEIFSSNDDMRAHDSCARYLDKQTTVGDVYGETNLFLQSKPVQEIRTFLEKQLATRVNIDDVTSLHGLCTFQLALHDRSEVCQIFDPNHLQVLEFATDLKHFYKSGFGFRINYEKSCRLLLDVMRRLDDVIDNFRHNGAQHVVVLRFGHAETIIPLFSMMGFYNDSLPLTSDNYHLLSTNRNFRSSTFSPFAANLLFVLYHDATDLTFHLAIVVNEHLLEIPGLRCGHFCHYDVIRELFMARLDNLEGRRSCGAICNLQ